MFVSVIRPSSEALSKLVEQASGTAPNYPEVGATKNDVMPHGYRHDFYEASLGTNEVTFRSAADALREWQAHRGAGVEVFPQGTPVAASETVVLLIRVMAFWAVAPCRVVYVVNDINRFGFAYGTLPGHPEIGEAAFTVERKQANASFCIRSFSRPANLLTRAGAPISRRVQTSATQRYIEALLDAANTPVFGP
jgi:uncharacterized protein (UPF0548 family)